MAAFECPPRFAGPERYVGVKVDAQPEMTPRRRIASVPYAIRAGASTSGGDVSVVASGVVPGQLVSGNQLLAVIPAGTFDAEDELRLNFLVARATCSSPPGLVGAVEVVSGSGIYLGCNTPGGGPNGSLEAEYRFSPFPSSDNSGYFSRSVCSAGGDDIEPNSVDVALYPPGWLSSQELRVYYNCHDPSQSEGLAWTITRIDR